jgi:chromosome segregation ATPase
MIGQALAEIEGAMQASVAQSKVNVDGAAQEKSNRFASRNEKEKALALAKTNMEAKTEALKATKAGLDEAKAALKAAIKAQTNGDKEVIEAQRQLEELEASLSTSLAGLKAGAADSKESKAGLKKLVALGKEHKLDSTLVEALSTAFGKSPADRSDFDNLTIAQFEGGLQKAVSQLKATLQEHEPARSERAAKVAGAQTACDAAKDKEASEKESLKAAEIAVDDAKEALKEASKAVTHFLPDIKKIMDGYDYLKESHAKFKDSILVVFEELKERQTPAPEPEVAEADEPVAAPEEVQIEAPAAGAVEG